MDKANSEHLDPTNDSTHVQTCRCFRAFLTAAVT